MTDFDEWYENADEEGLRAFINELMNADFVDHELAQQIIDNLEL